MLTTQQSYRSIPSTNPVRFARRSPLSALAEIFTAQATESSAPTSPVQDVIDFFKINVYKSSGRFQKKPRDDDESSSSDEEENEEDWDTDDFEGEESDFSESDHEQDDMDAAVDEFLTALNEGIPLDDDNNDNNDNEG